MLLYYGEESDIRILQKGESDIQLLCLHSRTYYDAYIEYNSFSNASCLVFACVLIYLLVDWLVVSAMLTCF